MARRLAVTLAFSLWWGGFTFYALVVVPIGTAVLGGATAQGFVTQPVTARLNVLGLVALAVLLWNFAATPRDAGLALRKVLGGTLGFMLAAQLALFVLHPQLDAMLDGRTHTLAAAEPRFYALHRVYLLTSASLWLASLAHVTGVVIAWRREPAIARA